MRDASLAERRRGLQELNLRRVVFTNEEHPLTVLSARPDAPALGRRLGGKFKAVAAAVRALDTDALRRLQHEGRLALCGEEVAAEEVLIDRSFRAEEGGAALEAVPLEGVPGGLLVLDATVDAAAAAEAAARDVVNRVQRLKKRAGVAPTPSCSSSSPSSACARPVRADTGGCSSCHIPPNASRPITSPLTDLRRGSQVVPSEATAVQLRPRAGAGGDALRRVLAGQAPLLAAALGRAPAVLEPEEPWGAAGPGEAGVEWTEVAAAEEAIDVLGAAVALEVRVLRLSRAAGP